MCLGWGEEFINKFHLNMRKRFFMFRLTEHLGKAAKGGRGEFLSEEILNSPGGVGG